MLCLRDTARGWAVGQIKRSTLVRIFAIAQLDRTAHRDRQRIRERLALIGKTEPLRDHAVIAGGRGKSLGSHILAEVYRRPAVVLLQFRQQCRIVGRIGDDGDEIVILSRAAHHGGSADIDILDNLVAFRAFGNGLGKGVEIDDHQINSGDIMFFHRSDMSGIIAPGKQAAMDLGVEGLDPAIHHFGEIGNVGNIRDLEAIGDQHILAA